MIEKLKSFFSSSNKFALFAIFLITAVIPLTVIFSQRQQNIQQKAAELPQEQNEIQNLTNQLRNNIEKITTTTSSVQQTKGTIIEETITIAKKRKDLLLSMLKTNPQDFLNNATLVSKQSTLPLEIQNYVERKIDVQGELIVLHADYFDEKKSKFEYYLKTDKQYKLHFVKDPPHALTDAKIRVSGIALDNNIALEGSTNQGQYALQIIAQATLPPTLGEQKIAVILANFTTNKSQPVTPSSIKQIMFQDTHTTNSIDSFYKENSFNKISFTGDVFGWYTISPQDCNLDTFALNAAKAAGVDTTKYNRFVFVFPNDNGCYPNVAGMGTIGGNPSSALIFAPASSFVFGHELGHNLGEQHANFLNCGNKSIAIYQNCSNIEYGDNSDVMGAPWQLYHFNGPHKVAVGWIPQSNIQHITTNGTYTIDKEETISVNPQILQIDKPDTDESYFLSYKQKVGYDLNSPHTSGASLHVWDGDNFMQTKLLKSSFTPGDYTLLDGGVFFNPIDGLEIKQLSHSVTRVTVAIRFGIGITPTPPPPPSPNGKIIYGTYDNTSGSFIYTIFPDGSHQQKFPVQMRNYSSHPIFSLDGKQVAIYFYNITSNSGNIVIYDYKGNRINEIVTPQSTYISNFLFMPDGKSLVVTSHFYQQAGVGISGGGGSGGDSTYTIYRVDTNGTNKKILIESTTNSIIATSVSSDGKKLLFIKDYFAMFMANIDGTNQEQLLSTNQSVYYPTFSPDNQSIIYTAWENNSAGLYNYNLATRTAEKIPIALTGDITGSSLSPDSKKLVFVYNDFLTNTYTLYTINLDGSNLLQITSIPSGGFIEISQPSWAPDPDFIQPTPTLNPTIEPTATATPIPPTPTPIPIPGDIDGDGHADIVDFTIWRCEFLGDGICVSPPSNKKADLNKDNTVDLLDFMLWRNAFAL